MTAPMPRAVSDHGPSVFCSRWPGASDSEISLSIDLQQKSWLSEVRTVLLAGGSEVAGCDKGAYSPGLGISRWHLAFGPLRVSVVLHASSEMLSAECQVPLFYRFAWPRAIFF